MRRSLAIVLLAVGTLVGYGSGIAHALHAHHTCAGWHHEQTP